MTEQREPPWYDRPLLATLLGGLAVASILAIASEAWPAVADGRIQLWALCMAAVILIVFVSVVVPALRRKLWGRAVRAMQWLGRLRISTYATREEAKQRQHDIDRQRVAAEEREMTAKGAYNGMMDRAVNAELMVVDMRKRLAKSEKLLTDAQEARAASADSVVQLREWNRELQKEMDSARKDRVRALSEVNAASKRILQLKTLEGAQQSRVSDLEAQVQKLNNASKLVASPPNTKWQLEEQGTAGGDFKYELTNLTPGSIALDVTIDRHKGVFYFVDVASWSDLSGRSSVVFRGSPTGKKQQGIVTLRLTWLDHTHTRHHSDFTLQRDPKPGTLMNRRPES